MARRLRVDVGGVVYHVLNRRVGRMTLFEKEQDYAGFEQVPAEAYKRFPMRLPAYCLMPNRGTRAFRFRRTVIFSRWPGGPPPLEVGEAMIGVGVVLRVSSGPPCPKDMGHPPCFSPFDGRHGGRPLLFQHAAGGTGGALDPVEPVVAAAGPSV